MSNDNNNSGVLLYKKTMAGLNKEIENYSDGLNAPLIAFISSEDYKHIPTNLKESITIVISDDLSPEKIKDEILKEGYVEHYMLVNPDSKVYTEVASSIFLEDGKTPHLSVATIDKVFLSDIGIDPDSVALPEGEEAVTPTVYANAREMVLAGIEDPGVVIRDLTEDDTVVHVTFVNNVVVTINKQKLVEEKGTVYLNMPIENILEAVKQHCIFALKCM